MSVAFLKFANKWLLMGCVVLTPILNAANLDGAALTKHSENTRTWNREEAQDHLVERLQKLVIDFHDNFLLSFWNSSFQFPDSILIEDALSIALVIKSMNPLNGPEFAGLLVNYYSAGGNYAGNLDAGNLCTTPNNASQLISEWLTTASLLADFINSRSLGTPAEKAAVEKLFLDWTKAQIKYLNNAAPQCANPSIPVNAPASDAAYALTRSLTYFIALEVFKAFERM
ncbi:MAG: hypothetical protein Q8K60_01430 [Parachlamydiaceae bacterium]|nr:hypothetical protein [Parachlamydiaceae bacterium]